MKCTLGNAQGKVAYWFSAHVDIHRNLLEGEEIHRTFHLYKNKPLVLIDLA